MNYARITLVLGVALLVIGIAALATPFGPPFIRHNPVLVMIVGALFLARYGARTVAMRRLRMLDEVPKRPLGLSDDDD